MMKILIWGTGNFAQKFVRNQDKNEIIGFIETNKSTNMYMSKPVYDSREIPEDYDYIVVANSYVIEIYNWCMQLEINPSKLIFAYRSRQQVGCVDKSVLKEVLSEKNYNNYCIEYGLISDSFVELDVEQYNKLNQRPNFAIKEQNMWPIIADRYAAAGSTENYFWQDLWAARLIIKAGTKKHFDIGSRLDGFIAHLLAAGIDVTMIDVREFPGAVENLHTIVDDATSLHQIPDESVGSMSALCSLEHFGLGRYGDPVDPEACFKCFENIVKKMRKGGRLYISVPIGKERVEFNAHRIFYAETIINCFKGLLLEEFSCTSQGGIEYNVGIHTYDDDPHNGEWRYGLFSFKK